MHRGRLDDAIRAGGGVKSGALVARIQIGRASANFRIVIILLSLHTRRSPSCCGKLTLPGSRPARYFGSGLSRFAEW